MKVLKIIGIFISILGIIFIMEYIGILNYQFIEPKRENARREVFENTQSYVEGKRQSITKYYNEWRRSDDTEKEAIRQIVLQEFANFDTKYFTITQLGWYKEIIKQI